MPYSEFLREYRSGVLENIHFGHLSAVNHMKEEIFSIGQDDQPVFFRSASKPFQAIPIFMTNVIDSFKLTPTESALFIASQRGEHYHQKALASLLSKLQLQESALACAESYPLNELAKIEYIRQGRPKEKFCIIVLESIWVFWRRVLRTDSIYIIIVIRNILFK